MPKLVVLCAQERGHNKWLIPKMGLARAHGFYDGACLTPYKLPLPHMGYHAEFDPC